MPGLLTLLWTISPRELRSHPARVALVIGSVATGVALLTAMRVATDSIVAGYMADLGRLAGKAELQVTIGTGEAGFSEDVLQTVRAVPQVRQAAALVRGAITFADRPEETFELFGVDVMQKDVLDLYGVEVLSRTADDFTIVNDPRAVFFPEPVARARGLTLESTVVLTGVDGTHEYTVRGIFAPKGLPEAFGGKVLSMYLPAAQPVAGKRGDLDVSLIDQIDVRIADGVSLDGAKAALEHALPDGLVVAEPAQRRILGGQVVEGLRATLVGMSTMALLASIFIVYASMTTMVRQRTVHMATLLTLGAQASTLVRTMIAEAAILGAIGSVVGVAIGLLLADFVVTDVASGMSLNYSIAFDSPARTLDPFVLFVVHPLGGMVTAAASALLPARALYRLDPLVLQRGTAAAAVTSLPLLPILAIGLTSIVLGGVGIWHGIRTVSSLWCTLGGVATIIGSVLALAPLLPWLWKASRVPLSRLGGVTAQLAAENLRRSSDRSLVTACAVALSIAVAIGASSLVVSFRSSVAQWYGFSGDALVSARASGGGWLPAPVSGEIASSLAGLTSVDSVDVLRVAQGQLFRGQRIAVAALSHGMLDSAIRLAPRQPAGGVETAARRITDGSGAAVSENFVRHFDVQVGDRIDLSTPTGPLTLPVVAVVSDYTSDKGSVVISRQLYQRRWNDSLVTYYSIRLEQDADIDQLRKEVARVVGTTHALSVLETREMIARVDKLIGQAFADIDTIKLLVIFLAVVGIGDLMASYVLDRRREMALLRLAGAFDSTITKTMAVEAACIGIAAALLGMAIGAVSAWVWVSFNYPIIVGYVLVPHFAWDSAAICLVLAVASAALAGVAAARFALLQPALEGVRYE